MSYKVAIIGAGTRGNIYMKALTELGGFEFTGICDLLPDRLAKAQKEYGFPVAMDKYEDLIRTVKPDIVVVATPAYFHCDIAKFAMENGAHVLTEKPFDLSLKKCFELKEVSERTGKKLAVGMQYRNGIESVKVKYAIERGLLGKDLVLNYVDNRDIRPKIAMHDAEFGNGGPMVDMTCHYINLTSWYCNANPVRVYALSRTNLVDDPFLASVKHKAPDVAVLTIEYDTGDIAVINVCWRLPNGCIGDNGDSFYATGTEGYYGKGRVKRANGEEIRIGVPDEIAKTDCANSQATVMKNLVRAIEGTGKVQVGADDAIITLATAMAAIRSSVQGRVVEVAEILAEKPTIMDVLGKR